MKRKLIIIAGAPKSFTTSVVHSLSCNLNSFSKEQHFLLERAETRFLTNRRTSDFSTYLSKARVREDLYVDGSMSYFTEPLSTDRVRLIKDFFHYVEVYVFLRDPFERIISCYNMDVANGWVKENLQYYLEKEISGCLPMYGAGPRYILESCYAKNISFLQQYFNKINIVTTTELIAGWWFPGELRGELGKQNSFPLRQAPVWFSKLKEFPVFQRINFNENSRIKYLLKLLLYKKSTRLDFEFNSEIKAIINHEISGLYDLLSPEQYIIAQRWKK